VRTEGGVAILMVCDRKEAAGGLPSRKQIDSRLREERVGVLARRYLRDLRAAATVDLRV
jgi:peptidyl-prolyl cis-trans isomerase SurA